MVAPRHGPPEKAPRGQHFLRSDRIAAELVEQAEVRDSDVVVEIGAGRGRLTQALAVRAGHVIAVEVDSLLAGRLQHRLQRRHNVDVVHADIRRFEYPSAAHRVFGNLPFAITTELIRELLERPVSALVRADLIVQLEVARKRATVWPSTMLSVTWGPWWRFALTRRLPAACFDPPPSVDAGMLSVVPRTPPMLDPHDLGGFSAFVRATFERSPLPVRRSLSSVASPKAWVRFAGERGIPRDARPRDLDVFDWVALYDLVEASSLESRRARPGERPGEPERPRRRPRRRARPR